MEIPIHKVFISFHHANDQVYKDGLVRWGKENNVFIDGSVDLGEILDDWDDQKIREYIRDEHLRDTTVTILLCGTETKNRKHIDWELYSSMIDGKIDKKSGMIVILLPSVKSQYFTCAHDNEKKFYPETDAWINITERAEFQRRYPYMPERIIDNLLSKTAYISVINWGDINVERLKLMIDNAYKYRSTCKYDLSRPMKRRNS